MKKLRPYIPVLAVGVVFVLLLGFVGFKLFQAMRTRAAAVAQVDDLKRDLRRLQKTEPFPSRGNIDQVLNNAARSGADLTNLLQEITARNFDPPTTEPAGFNRLLGEYINRWYGIAMSNSVMVAQEMGYGFEQYVAGQLPRADDVPNLMKQLLMTDHLMGILTRNHVSQIDSIRRLQFEGAQADTGGGGEFAGMMGMGYPGAMLGMMSGMPRGGGETSGEGLVGPLEKKDGEIHLDYPFEIAFVSNAEALRGILNEASRSPHAIVVTSVTVENLRTGESGGAATGGFPGMGMPGGMRRMSGGMPGAPGGGEYGGFTRSYGNVTGGSGATAVPYYREQRIVMGGRFEAIRAVLRLKFVEFDPLGAGDPSDPETDMAAAEGPDMTEADPPSMAAKPDGVASADAGVSGEEGTVASEPPVEPDLGAGGAP